MYPDQNEITMRRSNNYVSCVQCGVVFHAAPSLNRRFCSKVCRDRFLVGRPSRKPGGITVTCEYCRTIFKAPQSNARRFCSKLCFDDSRRKPKVDKVCEQCAAPFQVYPSADDTRFCSTGCRYSYLSGEQNAKWKPNVTLVCEQCGTSFERKPWQARIRFCSRLCRNHWLRNNITSPTGIEVAIEAALRAMGIAFEPQPQIDKWSCDFLIPSTNLVIECDGDYWHSLPRTVRKDAIKDQWLQNNGYQVLHLSEADINNRLSECKERIRLALLSPKLR